MSVPTERSQRRRQNTLLRVQAAAIRLATERGLDGFTMDDLAAEVDVSRRTLFNYVGDKLTAVLGADEVLTDERIQEFVSTETGGQPLQALMGLVVKWVRQSDPGADATELARRLRPLIVVEPRLAREIARRGAQVVARLTELLAAKEGWSTDDLRAHVIASTVDMLLADAVERTLQPSGSGAGSLTDNVEAIFGAFQAVNGVGVPLRNALDGDSSDRDRRVES